MKLNGYWLVCLVPLLLSGSVCGQTATLSVPAQEAAGVDLRKLRQDQIMADILKDAEALEARNRAEIFARMGNVLWEHDRQQSVRWLRKAVELALAPSTNYANNHQRITTLVRVLSTGEILRNDPGLGQVLLSSATDLLIAEVKSSGITGYGVSALILANQSIGTNTPAAFELGTLALKDHDRKIDDRVIGMIKNLKSSDSAIGDRYFAEFLRAFAANERQMQFLEIMTNSALNDKWWSNFSVEQQQQLFEMIATLIERRTGELAAANGDVCSVAGHGAYMLEEFQRVLPERVSMLRKMINVCRAKEPNAFRARKDYATLPELLAAAKEIPDLDKRAKFLWWAGLRAKTNKNYPYAIAILESFDENLKGRVRNWDADRVTSGALLLEERLAKNDFAGGDEVIDQSPERLRPYIILEGIRANIYNFGYTYPEEAVRLIERARSGFRKMDFPPPKLGHTQYDPNPAQYIELAYRYGSLALTRSRFNDARQYLEKRADMYEEYVDVQNQLTSKYASRNAEGKAIAYFWESLPSREMLDTQFERYYQSVGKLDSTPLRIDYRFGYLDAALDGKKFFGGRGVMQVEY